MNKMNKAIIVGVISTVLSGCVVPVPVPYAAKGILSPQVTHAYKKDARILLLKSHDDRWAIVQLADVPPQDGYVLDERDFKAESFTNQPVDAYPELAILPLSTLNTKADTNEPALFKEGVIGGEKFVYRDDTHSDRHLHVLFVKQKHKKKMTVGVPVIYPNVTEGGTDVDMAPIF